MTVMAMVRRRGFDVALQVKNPLPRAQDQFAGLDRRGERRAQRGCLQMRVAVAVVPGVFMAVIAAVECGLRRSAA